MRHHVAVRPARPAGGIRGPSERVRASAPALIALLAAAGLAIGIVALTTEPQTASLRNQVTSLSGSVNSAQRQISALQASLVKADSHANRLQAAIASLERRAGALQGSVGGLRASVGGLQGGVAQLQGGVGQLKGQTASLLNCVPELQQQLDDLKVLTTSVGGRLTRASLTNPTIVSKNCTKILSGS